MAAPPASNDSGMPLIEAYTVTYVSPALYEISQRAEKITWTFAIALAVGCRMAYNHLASLFHKLKPPLV